MLQLLAADALAAISTHDLEIADVPESDHDGAWPMWEVFVRQRRGLNHIHSGSLHAPDEETALQNARDVYTRRAEGVSIWVVRSSAIYASDPDDQGDWFDDNKPYRHPTFYEIPEEVIALIYQGVDTKRFRSTADGKKEARKRYLLPENAAPVLTSVGSFEHRKGHPLLFEALRQLASGPLPDIHLMLVGDGPDEALLRSTQPAPQLISGLKTTAANDSLLVQEWGTSELERGFDYHAPTGRIGDGDQAEQGHDEQQGQPADHAARSSAESKCSSSSRNTA